MLPRRLFPLALIALATHTAHARDPELVWLAGDPGSDGNLDGAADAARFSGRLSVQRDGDGILIVDQFANTVRRIDRRGMVATLAGKAGQRGLREGGAGEALFSWPLDAVRGQDGRIYVSDSDNDAIRVIAEDGRVSSLRLRRGAPLTPAFVSETEAATNAAGGVDEPPPILDDAYVVMESAPPAPPAPRGEWIGEPVDEPSLPAEPSPSSASSAEPVLLGNSPGKIALDADGRLWIVPQYYGSVVVVEPDGSVREWQPKDYSPSIRDIAVDVKKGVWAISDDSVLRISTTTIEIVARLKRPSSAPVATDAAAAAAAMAVDVAEGGSGFAALDLDAQGNVYIAANDRVFRLGHGGSTPELVFALSPSGYDSRDRPFTSVAIASSGDVLLAGTTDEIFRLEKNGALKRYAGRGSPWGAVATADRSDTGDARFNIDDTAVIRGDGELLYVSKLNHSLHRKRPDAALELWAGGDDVEGSRDGARLEARFEFPSDLALDRDGALYVADSGNGRIRKIGRDDRVTTVAGSRSSRDQRDGSLAEATFWNPHRLALDPRGLLYVIDNSPYIGGGATYLRRIDLAKGEVSTVIGRDPSVLPITPEQAMGLIENALMPTFDYEDIAVGGDGVLYAIEDRVVWRIDPKTGRHTVYFAAAEAPEAEASYQARYEAGGHEARERMDNNLIHCDWVWCMPDRIEVDREGRVYLSDSGNHTVIRIDPDGKAGIIAGQLGRRGNRPGTLPGALNRPEGLAWTSEGDLIITVDGTGAMLLRAPGRAPMRVPVPRIEVGASGL